jgi:hypothetical protein
VIGDGCVIVSGAEAVQLSILLELGVRTLERDGVPVPRIVGELTVAARRHKANRLRTNGVSCDGELLDSVATNTWTKSAKAAEAKGVTQRAVQRAVAEGRLKARRRGRELQIDTESLVEWKPRHRRRDVMPSG